MSRRLENQSGNQGCTAHKTRTVPHFFALYRETKNFHSTPKTFAAFAFPSGIHPSSLILQPRPRLSDVSPLFSLTLCPSPHPLPLRASKIRFTSKTPVIPHIPPNSTSPRRYVACRLSLLRRNSLISRFFSPFPVNKKFFSHPHKHTQSTKKHTHGSRGAQAHFLTSRPKWESSLLKLSNQRVLTSCTIWMILT